MIPRAVGNFLTALGCIELGTAHSDEGCRSVLEARCIDRFITKIENSRSKKGQEMCHDKSSPSSIKLLSGILPVNL